MHEREGMNVESRKQTYIATLALIVSIISLAVTYINEYRENLEIVADSINIVSVDSDKRIVNCEIEIIVANTSQHTVPLLRYKAYKVSSGFKNPAKEIQVTTEPEFPLTLISGGAEKILLKCEYSLDNDVINIKNKKELYEFLKKQWISIRIYTAKSSPYTATARFEN